jgi:ZIP family zinc transporter
VSAGAALLWGAFSSSSLYLGQALAPRLERNHRATGLMMGFGAGTLLAAVAYELIPESTFDHGSGIGIGVVLGAVVYFIADRIVDGQGGDDRQQIDAADVSGSGAAMFIGALLDGIPEAFVLGTTLALGGAINLAFVMAVFVSNVPQGVAGTTSLRAAGYDGRRIFRMWTALTVTCAVVAALGYQLASTADIEGLYSEAFAAGAVLTMLTDSMLPEAFGHGGKPVGLVLVAGYLVAAALTFAQ